MWIFFKILRYHTAEPNDDPIDKTGKPLFELTQISRRQLIVET